MNPRLSLRYRSARPSFTVIELIVVIFLITILLSLSLGVYFRTKAAFRRKEAEDIASKLQSQMDTQWKAVIDNCKDDAKNNRIPAGVTAMAGGETPRALIIWTKIMQRYEFPQSFDEALNWPLIIGFLQAKPSYQRALAGINAGPPDPIGESAALLYLNMNQSRRGAGAGFNATELLGAHAIGKILVRGKQFDCFVDTWGQPIVFVRWPTFFNAQVNNNPAAAYQSDLNGPPYWAQNTQTQLPIDPLDPESFLYDPNWRNLPATVSTNVGILSPVNAFNTFVHPLRNIGSPAQSGPINLSPIVVSAGPDQNYGLNMLPSGNFNTAPYYHPYLDFTVDPTNPAAEQDNIYGYRVRRMGSKGD